jgi:hypothetical protein
MSHHKACVIDNCAITPAQLRSNERLLWGNQISYKQAHRLCEAIIDEVDGSEVDNFALLPDLINRIMAADSENKVYIFQELHTKIAKTYKYKCYVKKTENSLQLQLL